LDRSQQALADARCRVYKHVVLGLIFIKYVSDSFRQRRAELEAAFRDPQHDY
jgi:type I restriction enzyme M protein